MGVERIADPGDLGLRLVDLHAPGIVAKAPTVSGVDQLAQRAMDEVAGAEPGEHAHQRGAQDDQENPALGAILNRGEGLRLVDTKADMEPPESAGRPE
jgi:hypothetical protein